MTSLEQVGLVTAETGTRIMPKSPQLAQIGRRRTAIVRRENHQCIPRNPERIQRTENVAHRRIHLHHEIPVRVGSRPPSEFRSGNGRCVGKTPEPSRGKTAYRPPPGRVPATRSKTTPPAETEDAPPHAGNPARSPRPPHLRPRTRRDPVTRHRRRSILTQVHERRHIQRSTNPQKPIKP